MPTIKFREFLGFARARNLFGYNQQLVGTAFAGLEQSLEHAMVLDAGAGRRLKHFGQQIGNARRLIGLDVDRQDLRANRDVDDRVVANVEQLPLAAGSIDCVLSVDVVEHLRSPAAFFEDVARCMRPGSILIVCTPNLLGYKNLITFVAPRPLLDLAWRLIKRQPGQPHRTYFRANTLHQLREICATSGLYIKQMSFLNEVSHFFYPYPFLATLAYLYGRCLELLGLDFLLNYMVCVIRKPPALPGGTGQAAAMLELRHSQQQNALVF